MKQKRYVVEMCNDFLKRFKKEESKYLKVFKARDHYLIGLISEVEVIKLISEIAND